jgi:cytochrome c551/c552
MPIGADVIGTNMGVGNCIYNSGSLKLKDTKVFSECQESTLPPVTTMLVDSAKLVSDKSPDLGKRTFEAICAGCHALNYRLIGPPIREIQAKYPGNPAGIAAYATAPQKVRSDFPQMPPQAYLGDDALKAVAGYMLKMR